MSLRRLAGERGDGVSIWMGRGEERRMESPSGESFSGMRILKGAEVLEEEGGSKAMGAIVVGVKLGGMGWKCLGG